MRRKQFFGEYLIQHGFITEEDMLEALAEQKRLTPSFEKVALEHGMLSMKQVFSILTRQAASDLQFAQIAGREGLLDQGQIDLVEARIAERRLGVGEVLVKLGRLDSAEMEEQLMRFHDEMEQFREVEALLLRVDLFKRLDKAALRTLSSIAIHMELEAGQMLIAEGEPADSLYVVCSGHLRVTKNNPTGSGTPFYLGKLGRNEIAGEASIFANARRSANVVTETGVALIKVERDDLIPFLRDHPVGAQSVYIHIINGLLHKLELTSLELSQKRKDGLSQEVVEDVLREMVG